MYTLKTENFPRTVEALDAYMLRLRHLGLTVNATVVGHVHAKVKADHERGSTTDLRLTGTETMHIGRALLDTKREVDRELYASILDTRNG